MNEENQSASLQVRRENINISNHCVSEQRHKYKQNVEVGRNTIIENEKHSSLTLETEHNNENNFKKQNQIIKRNNIEIGLMNIRSIKNKLNYLDIFLSESGYNLDIIIITESWLKDEDVKFYNISGYQTVANCRINVRGGGIIMFIKNDISFNILKNDNHEKSHLILINIYKLNLKICGFYRSPSTPSKIFFEILDNILEKNDNMICLGDANFNLINETDNNTCKYIDIVNTNNYVILNNKEEINFTYREGNHKSIIDHVIANRMISSNKYEIKLEDVPFTDHRFIYFKCDTDCESERKQKKEIIMTDYAGICTELNSFEYPNFSYEEYTKYFSNLVKKYSKTKMIKINNSIKKKQWIDRELRIELNKRKKLYILKRNNPKNMQVRDELIFQKKKSKENN